MPRILRAQSVAIMKRSRSLNQSYSFKNENHLILKRTGLNKYESSEFESGGYKWKLVLYPCGNAKKVGSSYISLYIAIAGANAIPVGSQVDVILKLLIYDQIQDKYLSIQDDRARRFHSLKTENGFDQLISLEMFSDPSNGYLVNDCCAFGAEVHVIKYEGKGEKFSIIREPANGTYTWKIQKFSTFPEGQQFSQEFTVAQHNDFRILELYPKGDSRAKGKFLSLFLHLLTVDNALPRQRVYSEYTLIVKDQVLETHYERIGELAYILF
ncbi:BTB/POZ and MATH domain-containing protein 2-like [Jatropha curcas]|uniref:BTB/POZ and MATH domain-containing protein 2-like n=1 Tax=Jatropha curcas TaxID=180498 RepID=UPI0018941EFE|nr:BTB/POZ and MATH domain-containing protein 2-like [Jatropha curcas]